MTHYYVSSVAYAAVAQWAASHAYSLGDYVRQLAAPTQGNERVFKCTTAGTSGGSEPSWGLNNNNTTTDGGVTWTNVTGQEAEQSGANWKAPGPSVLWFSSLFSQETDYCFVSSDHHEILTSNPNFNFQGRVISVSRGGGSSVPPVAADITPGAIIATATGVAMTYACVGYSYGLTLATGNGTSSQANLQIRTRGGHSTFEDCTFKLDNSNANSVLNFGAQGTEFSVGRLDIYNPALVFGDSGQTISFADDEYAFWQGAATLVSGSQPSSLIGAGGQGHVQFHGIDFTSFTGANMWAMGSINYAQRGMDFFDCKLPSGEPNFRNSFTLAPGSSYGYRFWNTENGGNTTSKFTLYAKEGMIRSRPDRLPPIAQHLNAIGSSVTATLELCSTHALTNADTWMELESLENSGDTLGKRRTTRAASIITTGTALTTTTSDWTAGAAVRQNSHAYALGDVYKAASNSGRLFICTGSGTSGSSEPGGVVTATDGSAVSDGTANFVAARRYKVAISFTPAREGDIRAFFCTTFVADQNFIFLDPALTVA